MAGPPREEIDVETMEDVPSRFDKLPDAEVEIVEDITPAHKPVKLLRDMEEPAKKSRSAFVVLLQEDDSLIYDGVGVRAKDLLWAIERMKNIIINEGYTPPD